MTIRQNKLSTDYADYTELRPQKVNRKQQFELAFEYCAAFLNLSNLCNLWIRAELLFLFPSDSPFGPGLIDDLLRELSGHRIVVGKLHVIRAAGGRNRIER